MKKYSFTIMTLFAVTALIFTACSDPDYPDSIFDEDDTGLPTPEITSVNPPDATYGATGERNLISISGTNFAEEITSTHVYFGNTKGKVHSTSATEMIVEPPALFSDSLVLKIDVIGAFNFGVYDQLYEIKTPITRPGNVKSTEKPTSIAVDGSDNVYFAFKNQLDMITPAGDRSTVGALAGSNPPSSIKFVAPNMFIYTVASFMVKSTLEGGSLSSIFGNLSTAINDFDFDPNDNLYTVGKSYIYRVDYSGASFVKTELLALGDTTLYACKVVDDKFYTVGAYLGADTTLSKDIRIWSQDINTADTTLSNTFRELFNFGATQYGNYQVTGMTVTDDGRFYLSTMGAGVIECDPATGEVEQLYPSLIGNYQALAMTWDNDQNLLVINNNANDEKNKSVFKIKMFEDGVPYHGRQ